MTTIVVMAKEPVAGRVKTRLCPPCALPEAARVAAAALHDTLDAVERCGCGARALAFDGRPGRWLRPGWSLIPQVEGDLGRRLDAAVTAVAGPVVLIGMDTPQVTPALLDDACARLAAPDVDAVLGPADDGGYWAIGFREPRAGAFAGVAMSRPDTSRQQRARLDALGLRVAVLPSLRDVDTVDDARAVAALVPGSAFARTLHDAIGVR